MYRDQLMRRRLPWRLVLVAFAFIGSLAAPAAAAQEEFADPSLLVSTDELEGLLGDVSVRVIDLRTSQPVWFGLGNSQDRDYTESVAKSCAALAAAMLIHTTDGD